MQCTRRFYRTPLSIDGRRQSFGWRTESKGEREESVDLRTGGVPFEDHRKRENEGHPVTSAFFLSKVRNCPFDKNVLFF